MLYTVALAVGQLNIKVCEKFERNAHKTCYEKWIDYENSIENDIEQIKSLQ